MTWKKPSALSALEASTPRRSSDALDKLGIAGQCYSIKPRDADFRMPAAPRPAVRPGGQPRNRGRLHRRCAARQRHRARQRRARQRHRVGRHPDRDRPSPRHRRHRDRRRLPRYPLCPNWAIRCSRADHWMRTGKDRVQVEATGVPVNIGDARVAPGDIVKGDADGVVVIRQGARGRVLEPPKQSRSEKPHPRSHARRHAAGRSAQAVQYHQLQTREAGMTRSYDPGRRRAWTSSACPAEPVPRGGQSADRNPA